MGRVGAAGDNAAMESFFSLLQKNVLNRRSWATREELRIAIVTWIERTYHRRRRQDALGRLTPVEFETIMTTPAPQAALLNLSPARAADPTWGASLCAACERPACGLRGGLYGVGPHRRRFVTFSVFGAAGAVRWLILQRPASVRRVRCSRTSRRSPMLIRSALVAATAAALTVVPVTAATAQTYRHTDTTQDLQSVDLSSSSDFTFAPAPDATEPM
jgi:hypothetical protein